ncbi:hypothetical protein COV16_07045, partial [Candidatus Woesearchaeota archaeon CG10_big_fil_rev_8_21_14_0_10_34_8]
MYENKEILCIMGLGYVGLPLAVEFSKHYNIIGFDINQERIAELQTNQDKTKTLSPEELIQANIKFTTDPKEIQNAQYVIIAVPTPIDSAKHPDLTYLKKASELVGRNIKENTVVIYESTVYPGVTENICLPILEKESGIKLGQFGLGYSPE